MRNVWRVFRRDAWRLLRVPASWIICAGICVIPALYAWFNIVGFWDPYGKTGNIQIAVANEDKGATNSLTGEVNLGDQIVDALKANDQLGWRFVSKAEAIEQVESGESYAAIAIPADFSEDMLSIVSGDFTQPKLEYYVNEKINAISPKVTDTGASTVDNTVNSQFVSTVSGVIADTVGKALDKADGAASDAKDKASAKLDDAIAQVADSRKKIGDMDGELGDMVKAIDATRKTVDTVSDASQQISGTLGNTSTLIGDTQKTAGEFIGSISGTLDQSGSLLSQASGKASASIGQTAGTLGSVQGKVDGSLQTAIDRNEALSSALGDLKKQLADSTTATTVEGLAATAALNDAIGKLDIQHGKLVAVQKQNANLGKTVDSVATTADSVDDAVQGGVDTTNGLRKNLNATALPQISTSLSGLAATAGSLSNLLTSQGSTIAQTKALLDQLDTTIGKTKEALAATDKSLANLQGDLNDAATDIKTLGTSAAWQSLTGKINLNADTISDFMGSPTKLETKTLFPIASYGSAMTPLFTDLSLWIGAFALVVIFKNEVDHEGVEGLTPTQAYMGRWLLFAVLSVAQGIIVCVGNLVIGVQTANMAAFLVTGVLTGLAFLSIIYALSVTFLHVGKGLCVVLVMLQIPGASGLYPIEMMPGFFRALYPLFPFTYGIDMMRETIGGFYGGTYWRAFAKMIVFVALSFLLGIVVRPYMTNLNRMFAKQIVSTDLMAGEKVQLPQRRFRMSQLLAAMSDKEELRSMLTDKVRDFGRVYPRLKWGALIAGIASFVALLIASALVPVSGKPVMLAIWTGWALLLITFLVIIEFMRDSLERQSELVDMSAEEIRAMFMEGGAARRLRRHAAQHAHEVALAAAAPGAVVRPAAAPMSPTPAGEAPTRVLDPADIAAVAATADAAAGAAAKTTVVTDAGTSGSATEGHGRSNHGNGQEGKEETR